VRFSQGGINDVPLPVQQIGLGGEIYATRLRVKCQIAFK
jgi:hypothetical protein